MIDANENHESIQRIKLANFHFNEVFFFLLYKKEEVKKETLNLLSIKVTRINGFMLLSCHVGVSE